MKKSNQCLQTYKAKATLFFVVRAVGRHISGWSVGKTIVIILRFRVGTSKNKNIDYRVNAYETEHVSVLRHSTMSSALNFSFLCFYCDLEEKDHIIRNINCKKKKSLYGKSVLLLF